MVLEIVNIEALFTYELASGWFKFGKKVERQKSCMPMGSRWGGALTRLGPAYCDICFYASLHCRLPRAAFAMPHFSEKGRISCIFVFRKEILILNIRFMNDYCSLWKGASDLAPSLAVAIN